jgi:hypothetical protein
MIIFPTYPQLTFDDGHKKVYESNVNRSEFESGHIRQVRRNGKAFVTRKLKYFLCSKSEQEQFELFYKNTLNYGANYFLWVDPVDGVKKRARIRNGSLEIEAFNANYTSFLASFEIELDF